MFNKIKTIVNVVRASLLMNKIGQGQDFSVMEKDAEKMITLSKKIVKQLDEMDNPLGYVNFAYVLNYGSYVKAFLNKDFPTAITGVKDSIETIEKIPFTTASFKALANQTVAGLSNLIFDALTIIKASSSKEEYEKQWLSLEKKCYKNIYFSSHEQQAQNPNSYDGSLVTLAFSHYLDGDYHASKNIMTKHCQNEGFEKVMAIETGNRITNQWFYKNTPPVYHDFIRFIQQELSPVFVKETNKISPKF